MKRVTHFIAANRGFLVNIAGFMVHRDILLSFYFVQMVVSYFSFLSVTFDLYEMRVISISTENNSW